MGLKVALVTRHHASLICEDAKKMLLDAGFEFICNDTGRKLSREEQKELIKDAFAIIAGTEKYDEDMLSGCQKLKTIIRFGVGTDNFDLDFMKKMGIQVGVVANHNAVAEFALTLILASMKNLPRYDMTIREGKWNRFSMKELNRKTVGIIGFGRIGMRLAELLAGFDVEILFYDPYIDYEAAKARNVTSVSLDELLRRSDVVSLHLPLTSDTYHLINAETISKMKNGAYLINTSRGSLVDEKALYDALVSQKLSGAGLDVFEREPVEEKNPLLQLSNNVLAPHVSALTYETNYNAGIICAKSIIQVYNGGKPIYPV
ncbi:MAG: phosphoglycerate dehydrogenase [Clostridiaceae bacterium]|nr:phosphoglycerate dehydrogenase [Clostridiaceae bacterium]